MKVFTPATSVLEFQGWVLEAATNVLIERSSRGWMQWTFADIDNASLRVDLRRLVLSQLPGKVEMAAAWMVIRPQGRPSRRRGLEPGHGRKAVPPDSFN